MGGINSGRKALPSWEKKTIHLHTYVYPQEFIDLKRYMRAAGENMNQYLRKAALQRMTRENPEYKKEKLNLKDGQIIANAERDAQEAIIRAAAARERIKKRKKQE